MRYLYVKLLMGKESVSQGKIMKRFKKIDLTRFFTRIEKDNLIIITIDDADKRYNIISLHPDMRNFKNALKYIPNLILFLRYYFERNDEKKRIISIIVDEKIEAEKTAGRKTPRITHDKIKIIKILLNHLYGGGGWERDILTGNIWNILPIDTFFRESVDPNIQIKLRE